MFHISLRVYEMSCSPGYQVLCCLHRVSIGVRLPVPLCGTNKHDVHRRVQFDPWLKGTMLRDCFIDFSPLVAGRTEPLPGDTVR